ncbi:MAG TPA: HEAT repeat domain-containing protein, partial [Gemmatales bacterium]|nr:HEAT repeat domain-containing protein [Gemmatales bacterium]
MSDEHADPVARILAEVTDPERMAPGQIEKLRELAALSDDLAVRAHALVALSRLAKPSEQRAIEAVLGALQSEHPVLREAADRALLGWGSRGVPAMLESIRENLSETAYCQHLISIMARIGTDAGAARPLLTHLMNHPKLGPAARAALPHLMPGWGHFGAWIGRQVLDWAIMASL